MQNDILVWGYKENFIFKKLSLRYVLLLLSYKLSKTEVGRERERE